MTTPDVRFAISERLTAFERTQIEAQGHDPDEYSVLVGVPATQDIQTAVQDGHLLVNGMFATPMQVIETRATLLDAAGRQAERNMVVAMSLRMIVKKSASALPTSDPASVFMTCVKAHDGYRAVLSVLQAAIPARSDYLDDDTIAFFTLTYQEASMISYRVQHLGLAGVVTVDHTPSVATAAVMGASSATSAVSFPGTADAPQHTCHFLPMWTESDAAGLWRSVLQAAPLIDQPRVRALAESKGLAIPRLASELPQAPIGMLADGAGVEDVRPVFAEMLERLER